MCQIHRICQISRARYFARSRRWRLVRPGFLQREVTPKKTHTEWRAVLALCPHSLPSFNEKCPAPEPPPPSIRTTPNGSAHPLLQLHCVGFQSRNDEKRHYRTGRAYCTSKFENKTRVATRRKSQLDMKTKLTNTNRKKCPGNNRKI